ncbi:hypothetical protein ACHAWX_001700 [Stephanocyclus meneghinianus]
MPCWYLITVACVSSFAIQNAMALGYLDFLLLPHPRHAPFSCRLREYARSYFPFDNVRGVVEKSRTLPSTIPISFLHRSQRCPQRKTHQVSQFRTGAASSNNDTPQIKTLLPTAAGNGPYYIEEEIIKKSRFIGIATPCATWEEAQLHLDRVRKDHPKSRHVCFGFVSGGGGAAYGGVGTERASDDGEPAGTAVRLIYRQNAFRVQVKPSSYVVYFDVLSFLFVRRGFQYWVSDDFER